MSTAVMREVETVTARELAEKMKTEQLELIDVRTPAEYREVHASPARNVPLETFDSRKVMANRQFKQNGKLYVICRSGNRSMQACRKLRDAGYENIVNVEGGTNEWIAQGQSVVRGKKAISLERQVRIAAGFLVLVGAILAYTVHIGFVGLSGFVGAGLMFAGITDTCGMAMLLARMPWNQVGAGNSCQTSK